MVGAIDSTTLRLDLAMRRSDLVALDQTWSTEANLGRLH